MAYKHLFIDSDILLDIFLDRKPFSEYSKLFLVQCQNSQIGVSTSALIIANIHYILSKKIDKELVKLYLKDLITHINVLPLDYESISLALDSNFTDFEDAIQHFIAQRHSCDAIITRNLKDYKQAQLPVLTAQQFLRTIN